MRTILPAVRTAARHFGLEPVLIQAIVDAEGGEQAIIRAVQCSLPEVATLSKALEVTCRTITHALSDFAKVRPGFIEFLGARWAPQGAANDPTNLNANWVRNVQAIYRELSNDA